MVRKFQHNLSNPGKIAVWVVIIISISTATTASLHSASGAVPPVFLAQLPSSFSTSIAGDTEFDPWHLTNFIGLFARTDGGQVPAPGVPAGHAQRIIVPEARSHPYDVSVYSFNLRPIRKRDKLQAAVWVRLAPVHGNRTDGTASLLIQEWQAPYNAPGQSEIHLKPAWQRVVVSAIAERDYAPGNIDMTLHLATATQMVDGGHGQLFDLGQ